MTAQLGEDLMYQGQVLSMQTEPLAPFLDALPEPLEFEDFTTACWRRYVGRWEIIDGRLYLVGIKAHWRDGTPVRLEQLFPGYGQRVFAHWFTGIIRSAQGEHLKYVHMGYGSTYERDLLLYFTDGVLFKTETRYNTLPK
jgi:hypothetical protein